MDGDLSLKIAGIFLIIFGIAGIMASGYAALKVKKLSETELTISIIEALTDFNLDVIKNRDEIKGKLSSSTSGIDNASKSIRNSALSIEHAGGKIKSAGEKLNSKELIEAGDELASAASELLNSSAELEKSVSSLRDVEGSLSDFFSSISRNIDASIQGIEGITKKSSIKLPLYLACLYFFILHLALFISGIALISAGESYGRSHSYGDELEEFEGGEP